MNNRRLIVLVCLLLSAAGALAAHWTVNTYAFQYDMTVYAVLQVNGRTVTDYSDYEVAALDRDGACRGVAKVQTATDGTKYLYLRIRSNETHGETLSFCVYQTSTNTETWMPETINFEAESVAGTPGEPIAFALSATKMGDVNGDGEVNEVDAQLILDLSVGQISLSDLAVPSAVSVPGGNDDAYEVNAQIVLDYSVATVKPW